MAQIASELRENSLRGLRGVCFATEVRGAQAMIERVLDRRFYGRRLAFQTKAMAGAVRE